jgi:RNA polymerase-binding transcription factor DksA
VKGKNSKSTSAKTATVAVPSAPAAPTKAPPMSALAKAPIPPLVPRPIKLVKAPAINADDPFDGIDELSDGEFLYQQRELLIQERASYTASALMLRAEADQIAADMEPGDVQFDDESGEGTGVSVERERDIAMAQKALETVDEIDRANHRIDVGTYGICEICHEPIKRDRLRALPSATQCIRCKNGGLSRR